MNASTGSVRAALTSKASPTAMVAAVPSSGSNRLVRRCLTHRAVATKIAICTGISVNAATHQVNPGMVRALVR